jgi:hypothetical protein
MKIQRAFAAVLIGLLVAGPAAAGDLKDELVAIDKALWGAWSVGNAAPFKEHLADDYVQAVAGAGVTSGKDKVIAGLSPGDCELKSFDFQDVTIRQLGQDVAILNYVANQDVSCGGEKLPPRVFSTSVYVRRAGKWLALNYQETPLQ